MNLSFYTGAVGASVQQSKLDVIGNNMANVNTEGYKAKNAGFVDLLYENINGAQADRANAGRGARMEKTDILFTDGGHMQTGNTYDYAIDGEGFFAVYDQTSENVYYTRKGNFHLSKYGEDLFYLADVNGNMVLDKDLSLIPILEGEEPKFEVGVFDFQSRQGFTCEGQDYFLPAAKDGDPFLRTDSKVRQGMLEGSNVNLANEMARIIETQRAYQMSLKMVQTSDEVEQTINGLRG